MKKNARLEEIRQRIPAEVKMIIDHSFAIVDRIDSIMNNKNISQKQLAEKLGKKESEVSKWMRGTHNFTLKTIAKLEQVLGEPILMIAKREPGIFVMSVRSGASEMLVAVRGERSEPKAPEKFYVASSDSTFQLNDPCEQYN